MQVSIYSAIPSSQLSQRTKAADVSTLVGSSGTPAIGKAVDFSRITPRQLLEYVNEQERSGSLDPSDGGALIDQVYLSQWDEAPDVPFDLRARLNGTKDFYADMGNARATWYAGLIERIDVLEAQSVRLDVFA